MNKLDAAEKIGKHIRNKVYDAINWTRSYQPFFVTDDVDIGNDLVCGYTCSGTACGANWEDFDFHAGTGGEYLDAKLVVGAISFSINSESKLEYTDRDVALKNMIIYEVEREDS